VDTIERSIAGGRTVLGSTRAGVVLSAVLGVALTVYTAMSLSGNASRPMTLLPIALLIGATLLVVALNDLETFVLAALAVRSSLDVFRGGSHLGDPSVVLGLLLLGFGALWLLNRRMKLGDAFPTSRLGLAFLVFTGVAMLGILTSAKPGASLVEWSRIASIAVLFLCVEQFVARGAGLGRFLVAIGMAVIVPTAVAACQLATRPGPAHLGDVLADHRDVCAQQPAGLLRDLHVVPDAGDLSGRARHRPPPGPDRPCGDHGADVLLLHP
jgi:hypothetical protein